MIVGAAANFTGACLCLWCEDKNVAEANAQADFLEHQWFPQIEQSIFGNRQRGSFRDRSNMHLFLEAVIRKCQEMLDAGKEKVGEG